LPPRRDLIERRVPTDGTELSAPFGPRSPKRRQYSIRAVDTLEVPVDLHTEVPAGDRMRTVRRDLDGSTVTVDRDEGTARIRTVVSARHSYQMVCHEPVPNVRIDT
jgi:hypothetical protein